MKAKSKTHHVANCKAEVKGLKGVQELLCWQQWSKPKKFQYTLFGQYGAIMLVTFFAVITKNAIYASTPFTVLPCAMLQKPFDGNL